MSDYTSWHTGMKVCCVDDPLPLFKGWKARSFRVPVVGTAYTIREIFTETRFDGSENCHVVFIRLNEITNAPVKTRLGPYEAAFGAHLFRPVQTRATDISIFTSMLTPSPKQRERVS